MKDQIKCVDCGKFIKRPYDSYTIFGCADPESPEPYDPEFLCRRCSTKKYKELLIKYKCCYRSGDWEKSNAEIRAAKEAGLSWIGSSGLVNKYTGQEISYKYIREADRKWLYVPYLEYQAKRREENRCKCYRVKDDKGNCPICSRVEVLCLCIYDRKLF